MRPFLTAILSSGLATAVAAQDLRGNATAGAEQFARQCVSCHVVVDETGRTLAGRTARTGPNLYGLAGQVAGSVQGFGQYSDGLRALAERGHTWDEESFVGYLKDPTGWLRQTLGDRRARGRMAYQVRDAGQAYDIYAYLVSLGP